MLRQALMTLVKGRSLAEHENPGEATVIVLRGRVRVTAGADVWEAREGDLLIVPSARHNLEAVEGLRGAAHCRESKREIMSHCVVLRWVMETGSFAAAGGCGR